APAPRATVHAEARRVEQLDATERMRALPRRPPHEQHAVRREGAGGVLRRQPAPREAELVRGAPRDGEVALPRIEGPLDDAERLDELGDDEVEIGVAVPVQVPR